MKNTVKLLGIVAIVAMLGFSFVACGEVEDDPVPLSVKITMYGDGVFQSFEIDDATAEDTGEEGPEIVASKNGAFIANAEGGDGSSYKYQWSFKAPDANTATEIPDATSKMYTLSADIVGTYSVKVTCGSESKTAGVKITMFSSLAEIFGTWFYKAPEAKDDERITFYDDEFKMQDYQASMEYVNFTIESCTAIEPSASPIQPEGYPNCYKIVGTKDSSNGYTGSLPFATESGKDIFYIYLNKNYTELRRINKGDATTRALQPQKYTRTPTGRHGD